MMNKYDCLIIGAGPCGIGCALKLKELNYNIAIIEKSTPGGKVNIAPRVDNYPREVKIPGPDLAFKFFTRLNDAGVELIPEEVISLEKVGDDFKIVTNLNEYRASSVLIACGTKERKLGLPKEDELLGHGISYCAICDGHFFVDKDVIVIGGGNSALKEAIYLSNRVHHLTLIHRRDQFRGLNHLVDELKTHENVDVLTPYIPLEILGEDKVTGIRIQEVNTKEEKTLSLDGIFPLVGQIPNSTFVKIEGVLDEWGTIPVDKNMKTSTDGLYAGGDILPREIRQIYLAEHDGMVAGKNIDEYLKNKLCK